MVKLVTLFLLAAKLASSRGRIVLSNTHQDYMVLQREPASANVWGASTCGAGTPVTVVVTQDDTGEVYVRGTGTVGSDSEWVVPLAPRPANMNSLTVEITDCDDRAFIREVLYGDIIVCAGQSNVNYAVDGTDQAEQDVVRGDILPHIRVFEADPKGNKEVNPLPSVKQGQWYKNDLALLGGNGKGPTTSLPGAMCYYTAYHLAKYLVDVPVAAIDLGRGGSTLPDWIASYESNDNTCGGTGLPFGKLSASLYETRSLQIAYIGPFYNLRFVALLWYQGEAENSNTATSSWLNKYACQQGILFNTIRRDTDQPDLFVSLTLLAPSDNGDSSKPLFWEEQTKTALAARNTEAVSIVDLGDGVGADVIHSPYKLELARRHSLNILRNVHRQNIMTRGPVVEEGTDALTLVDSGGELLVRVAFQRETSHKLLFVDTKDCSTCCSENSMPFEITLDGATWVRVPRSDIILDVGAVYLKTRGQPVVGVRLMWESFPQCALANDFGCTAKVLAGFPFELKPGFIGQGNILPFTVQYGDESKCPQTEVTKFPTRSPVTPAPTRSPVRPTARPTLPTGVYEYIHMHTGATRAPENTYGRTCLYTQSNKVHEHLVVGSVSINNNFYYYVLDHDGSRNFVTTAQAGGNQYNSALWSEGSTGGTTQIDFVTPVDIPQCKALCDAADDCIGIARWNNAAVLKCQLLMHCRGLDIGVQLDREVHLRRNFPGGFDAEDVIPGATCEANSLLHSADPVGEPFSPGSCFTLCKAFYTSHFVINAKFGCECYSGCDSPTDNDFTTIYKIHPADRTTRSPTGKPTRSPIIPTRKPTGPPTSKPTGTPTSKPTGAPTTKPTGAPTRKPTRAPTGAPTAAPTKEPVDVENLVIYAMVTVVFLSVLYFFYPRAPPRPPQPQRYYPIPEKPYP